MSPLLVGLQSTVGWSERGVLTGGAMFARFLGQSIGAAVFGAVTNAVLSQRLQSPPAELRGQLPTRVDDISRTLTGGHESVEVAGYLRNALDASTHAVFAGLLVAAVVTLLILLVVPRHFPSVAHDQALLAAGGAAHVPADDAQALGDDARVPGDEAGCASNEAGG
jgi:hypothetical protein